MRYEARTVHSVYGVSIRARHCWRAMPWLMFINTKYKAVSIRARHCWRAMPHQFCE